MGFREMRVEWRRGGHYAPGMVIAEPVRELWRDAWRGHLRLTQGVDEQTVLLTYEDVEGRYLTAAQMEELRAGWTVTTTVDPWTAANWLGYDGQTLCEDLAYQNRAVEVGRDTTWEAP